MEGPLKLIAFEASRKKEKWKINHLLWNEQLPEKCFPIKLFLNTKIRYHQNVL